MQDILTMVMAHLKLLFMVLMWSFPLSLPLVLVVLRFVWKDIDALAKHYAKYWRWIEIVAGIYTLALVIGYFYFYGPGSNVNWLL